MPQSASEVGQWLVAARAGSAEALGRLLAACSGYLETIARRELDPDLQVKNSASDLVQETFLEAQRDFPRFQGSTEDELLAWLRQMLLNNIGNFARRYRGTQKRQLGREVSLDAGASSEKWADELMADSSSPSEKVMRQERAEAVARVLAQLPEDYRLVLLYRYQEQLSFEEIAQRMGRSSNAARKLWARAVECFQNEMGSPP
jgi:RNA polymerase sigma-70 factor (ECF subfamily)